MVLFVLPRFPGRLRVAAVATVAVLFVAAYQVPGVADLIANGPGTRSRRAAQAGRTSGRSPPASTIRARARGGLRELPDRLHAGGVAAAGINSLYQSSGYGPHNIVVGTMVELGPLGLMLLALFLGPLVLRRGWGPDAAMIQAALASLLIVALFLDILANRKQVWLIIGFAAGLGVPRPQGSRGVGHAGATMAPMGTEDP